MGSSSKQKHRDRDANGNDQGSGSSSSRKRKHHTTISEDRYDRPGAAGDGPGSREKRHKHKKHHRDKKREKYGERQEYASSDSDVVEVVPQECIAPDTAGDGQSHSSLSVDETNRMRSKLGLKPLQVGSAKSVKTSSSQPSQQPSPQTSRDSLSISDTDQLRAKLGLKPLRVGAAETASRDSYGQGDESDDGKLQDDLGEFYHRPAGNITADKKAEKIKQKLDERKARRAIETKLSKIKSLGMDANDGHLDDPLTWVDRSRQTESAKATAARRAAYLDALDEQFGVAEVIQRGEKQKRAKAYGEKQLKGLRVGHDVGRFMDGKDGTLGLEGKQVILTLKDHGVLDDDDDVLINVNMVDDERYEKSNLNKTRKLPQDFYSDDQLDEYGNPLPQSVLGKYDEDIDGNKATSDHFIIGQSTSSSISTSYLNNKTGAIFNNRSNAAATIKEKLAESLLSNLTVASEYYNEDEMAAFKKPKKVRKKIRVKKDGGGLTGGADAQLKSESDRWIEGVGTRRPSRMESNGRNSGGAGGGRRYGDRRDLENDDVPVAEDFDGIKMEDENEDHLERALSKARRLKQQERNESVPKIEEILSHIKPEIEEVDGDKSPNYEKDFASLPSASSSIILNSTAEFCRTLGDIPTYGRSGNRDDMIGNAAQESMETIDSYIKPNRENNHGKHRMITMEIDSDDEETGQKQSAYNDNDDDDLQIMETDGRGQSRWSNVDSSGGGLGAGGGGAGIGDKPILDEEPDVGAGVGAALKLAMSKGYLDKDETNRPSNTRLAHLQAKHYSIEDKSHGEGGEGERPGRRGGSAADRYCGPVQDFKEKETFRPNVKLEYIDDDGHILNAKEAFRYLSHKFHGKGPGKNKVEKRIKKSQQEGLMKKMSSTDTPLGTLNMLQNKQKEMQSAFIVLSGGKHTHSTTTAISKSRR